MADDARALDAEHVEQRDHVFRVVGRTEGSNRFVGFAESPEVRSDEREAILQALHDWLPGEPELGPSVQQEQRFSSSGLGDMELSAIRANGQVLHMTLSPELASQWTLALPSACPRGLGRARRPGVDDHV